ncbi:MAG: metallophosphoesterase [Gudongella sp.]|nr:metallophosphoesterase [Gudongella sp.]
MDIKKILILTLLIIVVLIYNQVQISNFKINQVSIESKKVNSEIKISQITDFHSNKNIDITKLAESIKKYNPNFIVLTGDIIDSKTENLSLAFALVDGLNTVNKPIYFVEGNHEGLNSNRNEFIEGLVEKGVYILDNKTTMLDIEGEKIRLIGLPFFAEKDEFQKVLDKASQSIYDIVLSHSPNRPISYLDDRIDLVLSGHTHGGQIRLPIIGGLVAPGQGIFPKYDKGLMQLENGPLLYIDSGLGNSLLPIRFLNPVQISEITISPLN